MTKYTSACSDNSGDVRTTRIAKEAWHPTKAERHRGRWRASRKGNVISRLVSDLQIAGYQEALTQHARGRLVDVGSGNAPLMGIYAPLVEDFLWVDWPNSPHQMFELDVEVDLNDIPLPFANASFDTILLSDVLEHIAEPDLLFSELSRILSPNGRLILGVPFYYHLHEQPFDFHRYTRHKLAHFGRKHSLAVLELRELGGGLDVAADVSCKVFGAIWPPLARLPYYGWKLIRSIPPLSLINRKLSKTMPLAYLAVYTKVSSI